MNYKKEIIYWARLLNEKGLVNARNGNISLKRGDNIAITAHATYLGRLTSGGIVLMDKAGNRVKGRGEPSSEKALHLSVHNRFPGVNAVVHAHPPYTTAFFHYFEKLDIFSYEAKFYLGEVGVIEQKAPMVMDTDPVVDALSLSNIAVLGNHGAIAMGRSLQEAFGLIELLEEQARINFTAKAAGLKGRKPLEEESGAALEKELRCALFSPEHIRALKDIINNDQEARDLGRKHDLTCTLAVRNEDSGGVICFHYRQGEITAIDADENAEFVISSGEDVLKKVFNRQIDPFAASTQGKVRIEGSLPRLSRWYPVMARTFALWGKIEVF